jgi:hypothetical protein
VNGRADLLSPAGDPRVASRTDQRERLGRHGRLWAQDDLTYFRTSAVDWR